MNDSALGYLHRSGGWELGTGPSIVVVDKGLAKSLSTTTVREGVYAFFFAQKGLMAGLGLQGSKITEITPDRYVLTICDKLSHCPPGHPGDLVG